MRKSLQYRYNGKNLLERSSSVPFGTILVIIGTLRLMEQIIAWLCYDDWMMAVMFPRTAT